MISKRTTLYLLAALLAAALALCYLVARPFLSALLVAVTLAVAFYPMHYWIERRVARPALAAVLSLAVIVLAIALPTVLIGLTVAHEIRVLTDAVKEHSAASGGVSAYLGELWTRLVAWSARWVDLAGFDPRAELASRLQAASGTLLKNAGSLLGNLGSFLLNSFVALFAMFFLFRDGGRIEDRIAAAVPLARSHLDRLLSGVRNTIQASMYGILAVALAQGVLLGLGLWTLGVPAPVLWGAVAVFASLIPLVGCAAVWIPAAIWLAASGHWVKAVVLVGWGAGAVGMVDNFLRPYIMSDRVKMHPLLLFFALLGGVQAFGMIGLFAGPVILAVTRTLFELLGEELRPAPAAGEPPPPVAGGQPPDAATAPPPGTHSR